MSNHTRTLRESGQFVVRESIAERRGDRDRRYVNQSFAADVRAGRFWFGVPADPDGGVYDSGGIYQNETAVCRPTRSADATAQYRCSSHPQGPEPREFVRNWVRRVPDFTVLFPFERNGTVTVDGEAMARYTASEPPYFGCDPVVGPDLARVDEVTRFRATAIVDDRGVVRRFDCVLRAAVADGGRHSESYAWTITEVGTATVRPPTGNETGRPPVRRSRSRPRVGAGSGPGQSGPSTASIASRRVNSPS